jgi:histidine triad (HIT) family protein
LIVYADEGVVVFPPPEPAALGHMLLIPRVHVPDIWGLTIATAEALARTTLRVAKAVREAVRPEGLSIIQSNGAAATQTVDHVHVHVLPRWSNDGIGPSWPADTSFPAEARQEAAADVRTHLERGEGAHD